MTVESDPNRRDSQRFDVRLETSVLGASDPVFSRDISETGLFLETSVEYEIGACVPLRLFHSATGEILPAVCKVVRLVNNEDGTPYGVGLSFSALGEGFKADIRQLLESRFSSDILDDKLWLPDDDLQLSEYSPPPLPDPEDSDIPLVVLSLAPDELLEERPLWQVQPDVIPLLVPDKVHTGLSGPSGQVLALVNGQNTVSQILSVCGLSLAEVATVLVALERHGFVSLPDLPADQAPSEDDISDHFPRDSESLERQSRRAQLRLLMSRSLVAQRTGRVQESVQLLELALTLAPDNEMDIRTRIVLQALDPIGDFDLAEEHATIISESYTHSAQGRRLCAEISSRKKKANKEGHEQWMVLRPMRHLATSVKKAHLNFRQRLLVALSVAFMLAGIWGSFVFFSPTVLRPHEIPTESSRAWVKASRIWIYPDRMVVKMSKEDTGLARPEGHKRLHSFSKWASHTWGVDVVYLVDKDLRLVAEVRSGRVRVF
ncbi:PilZ domain-containing protein [Myxococcota bacterium]|nr:PilZ domain-containing protein [Myxococcota bacterium]